MKTVLCIFKTGECKSYKTDLLLKAGDKVIIETNKQKLKIVEVFKTDDISNADRKKAKKWIVQKVDMTEYLSRESVRREEEEVTKLL
jgi:hypothetical protein